MNEQSTEFKFGFKPSPNVFTTLHFETYANVSVLPAPADKWRISHTPTAWPMYKNDQYGCCTVAMIAHLLQAWALDTGQSDYVVTDELIMAMYWAIGNLEHPNQPNTDQGLMLIDVYRWMRKMGLGSKKILAFVKVKPENVQLAAGLFDGVGLGFQCQQNVIADFNAGRPWTPGTMTSEGHAVPIIEYDSQYLNMVTWAKEQKGTYPWAQRNVFEYWAAIPEDFQQKVPSGFDIEALWADLGQIDTSDSPTPDPLPPMPTPPPNPTPDDLATLAALIQRNGLNWALAVLLGSVKGVQVDFTKAPSWPLAIQPPGGN